MILRYTRQALDDLSGISARIARERPWTAVGVGIRIRQSIDALADFPERGRAGRVPGTRELVVPGLPYLVAYRVGQDFVDILAVRHGAQEWPARL